MPMKLSALGLVLLVVALFSSCAPFGGGAVSPYPQGGTQSGGFALGIDRLAEDGFGVLRGKRVGLITNQTSLTRNGTMTRVAMQRGLGGNLTALYTPEHGLDGREKAGLKVQSRRDPVTGLTAFSLYGDTRKPTPQMLSGIDVLVFDLQDIGSRSYTYISTMALAMEAAAENGKEFVVLDRPNPLGGLRVYREPIGVGNCFRKTDGKTSDNCRKATGDPANSSPVVSRTARACPLARPPRSARRDSDSAK